MHARRQLWYGASQEDNFLVEKPNLHTEAKTHFLSIKLNLNQNMIFFFAFFKSENLEFMPVKASFFRENPN